MDRLLKTALCFLMILVIVLVGALIIDAIVMVGRAIANA